MKNLSLTFIQESLKRRQSSPTHTINSYQARYPSGVEVFHAVAYPHTTRKSDRLPMLKDLINHGFNQKEAAEALDMSTSYASKLLKK